jgi:hypothetical protein
MRDCDEPHILFSPLYFYYVLNDVVVERRIHIRLEFFQFVEYIGCWLWIFLQLDWINFGEQYP